MKSWNLLILFLLIGCLQQGQNTLGEGKLPEDVTISLLTISPPNRISAVNEKIIFSGIGGYPPYQFSLHSGLGTITSQGEFTAPASAGTTTVKVLDSQMNSAFAVVTTSSGLILSPASAVVKVSETYQFTVGGGVSPYSYSLTSGAGSVTTDTGLFTAAASPGTVNMLVTDAQGNSASATVTVVNALTISPKAMTMEDGSLASFSAGGGTPPYTYSVYAGEGAVNASSGIFTAGNSSGTVLLRVQDANGAIDEASIVVVFGPEFTNPIDKVKINGSLNITAAQGKPPLIYSIVSGSGSIDASTGLFSAPTTSGLTRIRVTDANGLYQEKDIETFYPASVSIGENHLCLVRRHWDGVSSEAKCAGRTTSGQLGTFKYSLGDELSDMGDQLAALNFGPNLTPIHIYAGFNHRMCVLFSDDRLKCFGENGQGGAGINTTYNYGLYQNTMGTRLPFVNLGTGLTVDNTLPMSDRVALGGSHSCAIVSGGNLKCWGYNAQGQLGLGNTTRRCDWSGNCGDNLPLVPLGGESVLQVSAGEHHTCALLSPSLRVKCWGYNAHGQLGIADNVNRGGDAGSTPDLLNYIDLGTYLGSPIKVKSITSGAYHNCALLENDTVKCWGYNGYGQLGLGHNANMGDNGGEMGDALSVISFGTGKVPLKLDSKVHHNCALFSDNSMKCWGYNDVGTLGYGDTSRRGDNANEMGDALPVINLGGGETVKSMSAGYYSNCAITQSDKLKCWGRNVEGNLGVGDQNTRGDNLGEMGDSLPSVNLGTGLYAVQVAVSQFSQCALLNNSQVKCWGLESGHGILGQEVGAIGGKEMMGAIPPISFGAGNYAKSVHTSWQSTCFGMMDSSFRCMGANSNAEFAIGHGSATGRTVDTLAGNMVQPNLGTGLNFSQFKVGASVGCALVDDGRLKCWGYGPDGRHGLGTTATIGDQVSEIGDSLTFVDLGSDTVKSVHTHGGNVCVLLNNGQAKCWGYGNYGALGTGDNNNRGYDFTTRPANLPYIDLGSGRTIKQMDTGENHSCAILDNDKVKCWGRNDYGQLGLEDNQHRGDAPGEMGDNLPYVDLGTNLTPIKISLGRIHSCVLFSDQSLKCWGYELPAGNGDIGRRGHTVGTMGTNLPFVNYSSSLKAIDVATGGYVSCVVLEDNTIKCWGDNSFGQLGLGHTFNMGSDPLGMGDNLPSF